MANYQDLKDAVATVVKANGNQEITGPILHSILLSIISTIGINYTYAGIATPITNPGMPDQNVFYIATKKGTYPNFSGLTIKDGDIAILKNTNNSWSVEYVGLSGIRKVALSDLDSIKEIDCTGYYLVEKGDGSYIGTLIVTEDVQLKTVSQLLISDIIPTDSNFGGQREPGRLHILTRLYNSVQPQWTKWTYYGIYDNVIADRTWWSSKKINDELLKRYKSIGFAGIVSDTIMPSSTSGEGTEATVYFSTYLKRFCLKKNANYYSRWDNSSLWNDKAGTDSPVAYRDCYYVNDGKQYLFNGTTLSIVGGGEIGEIEQELSTGNGSEKKVISQKVVSEEIIQLKDELNTLDVNVAEHNFTSNTQFNDILKQVSVDISNYNGETPLGKLSLVLYNQVSFLNGIQILNDGNRISKFEKFNYPIGTTEFYLEGLGCKFYVEVNLNSLETNKALRGDLMKESFRWDSRISNNGKQIEDLKVNVASNTERIIKLEKEISPTIKNNKLHIDFTENAESYIENDWADNKKIRLYFILKRSIEAASRNPCFNFQRLVIVDNKTQKQTIVHYCYDDIAPASINVSYMGGNHGCSKVNVVTCNSHGKTFADIGAKYSYGGKNFYIINIVDENKLGLLSDNNKKYPEWDFDKLQGNETLTYVSGGQNTQNIIITDVSIKQLYPSLYVSFLKVIVDGQEIQDNGDYFCNKVEICEDYNVCNPASVLEKIKLGGFESNPIYNDLQADINTKHTIIYSMLSADKTFVSTSFTAMQKTNLSYFYFTQQGKLEGEISLYIPKTKPIQNGEDLFDFRTITPINSISPAIYCGSEYWENVNLPPDRWIEISDNIAFLGGFLFDYGIGGSKRKDYISRAFSISNELKVYPFGIDGRIIPQMNEGDTYFATAFRIYKDKNEINKNGIISKNIFKYNNNIYLYIDFNQSGIFKIEMPLEYYGYELEVFEKSSNVKLLAGMNFPNIEILVNDSEPLYGYLVAKISIK